MSDLIIIGIVLIVAIAGWFIIPYLKKQVWFKDDNIDGVDKAIDIARMLLSVINVDDVTRNKTKFVLDVTDAVVNYIAGLTDDGVDKKVLSLEVIEKVLKEIDVSPTPEEQALIERLIEEVLFLYENKVLIHY